MSLGLDPVESRFAAYLSEKGLEQVSAQVLSVAVCRNYCLSREELIAALEYYITEDKSLIPSAIDDLLKRGLLSVVQTQQESFIRATESWEKALLEVFGAVVDTKMLEAVNTRRELYLIERVGWAGRTESRQAFRDAILQARSRIRLGVYSSKTVFPEIADAIRSAMLNNSEMRVEILMLSPRLARKIEDNPNLANDVMTRTKNWMELFASVKEEARAKGFKPTLQVRWVEDETMVAFLRSMLIDNRLWIMNIHRPGFERGIDGIVYRGFCDGKNNTNLFTLLDYYWNAVWKDSTNPNPTFRERVLRALHVYRNTILGLSIGLFSLPLMVLKQDTWAYALQGAAVTKIAEDWSTFIEDLGRLLEKIGLWLQNFSHKQRKK